MLSIWNDFDIKASDADQSIFKAKTDLWLSVAEQTSEGSSGTEAFLVKVLEHLATNSEAES